MLILINILRQVAFLNNLELFRFCLYFINYYNKKKTYVIDVIEGFYKKAIFISKHFAYCSFITDYITHYYELENSRTHHHLLFAATSLCCSIQKVYYLSGFVSIFPFVELRYLNDMVV